EAAARLQTAARQLAALSRSPRPARTQMEQLTLAQERLQAELSDLSSEAHATFKQKALTPQALSNSLPEGVVLVDYLFYWRSARFRDGRSNMVRHVVAFVSRKGRATSRIDLGPAERIEDAIARWRPLLVGGKPALSVGAEVKGLIWSPLEKDLKGA